MKTVKDFAVRLDNRPGALSELSDLLGSNGIEILALTVRTEGPTGTINFVSTDPVRAVAILEGAGYTVSTNEILAAECPQHPGGLAAILKPLKLEGVNVEYLYSCVGRHGAGDATVILLGIDNLQAAHDALTGEWIRLYGEELYNF
ncbi:MAG: ACT domain-containing protein [Thermodesulfobacteriota bacterium]